MRPSKRAPDELRAVSIELNPTKHAEGACLISMGDTKVLCTASFDDRTPPWLRGQGRGWVTAEYGMLPRATHTRSRREAAAGKQSGRTQEIPRLIGRALRSVTDLKAMGETQITLDCDVIQADGGTRCASITGAWVALSVACNRLVGEGVFERNPVQGHVSAISCGVWDGEPVLDLDYEEDSRAKADANFAIAEGGKLVEVQMTGEEEPIEEDHFIQLLALAKQGCSDLQKAQSDALKGA